MKQYKLLKKCIAHCKYYYSEIKVFDHKKTSVRNVIYEMS